MRWARAKHRRGAVIVASSSSHVREGVRGEDKACARHGRREASSACVDRVHHGYTPGYRRQTRTRTRNGSVPAPRVWVWSQVPSLVSIPVPAAGIPVGDEQGGRAKVRATQATAQCTQWCALYRRFCSSQGGDGMAGASSSSGRVTSRRLMCEDEAGASSSLGQQGRVVGRIASRCLRCEDEAWALLLLSGRGRRREGDGEGALSCQC